uniref:ATP synthase F0 subunit 8 n=1 Tax=Cyanea nozakii TaxID=135523 RepID=A0A343VTM9_CYANO|nr:ATP synthase F0 subunit 8 [Cyanea nozakii]
MPQLDFVTYFNQYVSLIMILTLCLLIISKSMLFRIKIVMLGRNSLRYKLNGEISSVDYINFKKIFVNN